MQAFGIAFSLLVVLVFAALAHVGLLGELMEALASDDMAFSRAEHDEHETHPGDLSTHERV
jgi:hypothetical protein